MASPKFPKPLVLEKIGDRLWKFHDDFWYYVGDPKNNDLVICPAGMITDMSSTPRLFWSIYPPDGKYLYGAAPHDAIYFYQTRTRKEADFIFWEAMKEIGVGVVTRNIMYNAVRMFGWIPWNKRSKELRKNG